LFALFLTLPLKSGWQWVRTGRNLNIGVSRNRFCDFLADPDSRSFSRFGAIIVQFAVTTIADRGTPLFSFATYPCVCVSRACLDNASVVVALQLQ